MANPLPTAVKGDGTPATPVGKLALWQMNNQSIDTAFRVGFPIAAYFAWKVGHKMVAGALIVGAAVLWVNRTTGANL